MTNHIFSPHTSRYMYLIFFSFRTEKVMSLSIQVKVKGKGKVIPLQA